VARRACERAVAEAYDVVVVDTSGRLSNNRKLNQELKGIKAAIGGVVSARRRWSRALYSITCTGVVRRGMQGSLVMWHQGARYADIHADL
jgi:SRP54-type protein, GTPase domain